MANATTINPGLDASEQNRTLGGRLILAGMLVLAAVVAIVATAHSTDLLANNSVFTSISKSSAVTSLQTFVSNITGQLKLVGITLAGLAGTFVAAMYAGGHTNAHGHAMRIGFGVLGLVAISGIVS